MKKAFLKIILALAIAVPLFVVDTNSFFTSENTLASSNVSSGCWAPPSVPVLLSPADNTYGGLNSAWNSNPVMDWDDSTTSCPLNPTITYQYESYRDAGLTALAYRSGMLSASRIPAPGTPEGNYWWRVRACDSFSHCSVWSAPWKFTVDRTAPLPPSKTGWTSENPPVGNYETGSELNEYITCDGLWTKNTITNVWGAGSDNLSGIDHYIRKVYYSPFGGTAYSLIHTNNNQQGQWVNQTGGIADGRYQVELASVDKAGNQGPFSTKCMVTIDKIAPSAVNLSITGSYTKTLSEKIDNGGFENDLDEWETAGDVSTLAGDSIEQPSGYPDLVITPYEGTTMARVGSYSYPGDSGNMVWENRLMQSIPGGAKSLSLHYNYVSSDYIADEPGFFIRLNGNEVFEKDYDDLSAPMDGDYHATGWEKFYYDLSDYSTDDNVNLAVYAGNMIDDKRQSLVYVDEVTTYFLTAPEHAVYTLTGTDAGSGIDFYRYKVGGGEWQTTESTFQVKDHGNHWIEYKAVDNAGNESPVYRVHVITDTHGPGVIADLVVEKTGTNYVALSWTAPGNDDNTGRAAKYDIRYSLTPITDEASFNTATPAAQMPVPQYAGETDSVEILGLNPDTLYYFAVRAADEAPNWSPIVAVSGTTEELDPGETISYGDIVINELMWMGSSVSTVDEWIELRNMTDRDINLKDFKIEKYDGSEYDPMITLPDKIIPAKGYFLLANFTPGSIDSQLKPDIIADYVTTGVDLNAGHLQLQLTDSFNNPVDEAWDYEYNLSDGEGEGLYDGVNRKYYSMERTSVPGDGTDPLNWYTCIDFNSKTDFFTIGVSGSDVRGTPGSENRSENEPYSRKRVMPSPTPTVSSTPSAQLILSENRDSVTIKVNGIKDYTGLVYLVENGATGNAIADNSASPEMLTGQETFEARGIILETCSGGVCMKMTDTENLRLEITLMGKEGKEIKITSKL